ncbi:MAG: hypothetical protein AVDCRST_MAG32-1164 [uncultured Nocardioides sp.]|uniref:DUF2269 family protein n=1 Tax=uncultured Nocardioides sp. TaxID=198441 RepID=A0A6J4N5W5_9ACTN|nr:MAG: hypothetical protein AVDCRST_MAG32-1164 [uncultured Nocardioides sp.]
MTKFVMALFVIQVVGGLFQMGTLMTAGSRNSTARASRLPDLLVFSHAVLGFLAAGLWVGQLLTGDDRFAWVTLAVVALSIAGGTVMFLKTELGSETLDRPAADPADVRVAEKQIPKTVLHGHGLGAAVLAVCVLVVAL